MRANKRDHHDEQAVVITAWCQGSHDEQLACMFQLHSQSIHLLKKIEKMIQGSSAGCGYDKKKRESILLVRKYFPSPADFEKFIINFEFKIERVR